MTSNHLSESEHLRALADIQAKIIEMRRMAGETTDPRKRDACLRIADAIEEQARKLDHPSGAA